MKLLPIVLALCATFAGCQRVHDEPKATRLSEAEAVTIARRAIGTNSAWLQSNVFYRARPVGLGWSVLAEIIGTNDFGEPFTEVGGHRIITIDQHGTVTGYMHGR